MPSSECWGEQNPTDGETSKSWQLCKLADGRGIPVEGDADWGKARVFESDPVLTDVVDTGDAAEKTLTLTRNKYGTGDTPTLYIRGSETPFNATD
jgi:hypothetical protein